jgi:hypothetical protein
VKLSLSSGHYLKIHVTSRVPPTNVIHGVFMQALINY